jgi:predicted nucleotidyltransferase
MARTAFLSVRLPPEIRNRVKAAAAVHGQTVQELVGSLVEQFLAEQDRSPPALPTILSRLRNHEAELRQRGIVGLWVFGSVARGEARLDSDIDVIAQFHPQYRLSATNLAGLRAGLSDLLGAPIHLIEWAVLTTPARSRAEREAVQAF